MATLTDYAPGVTSGRQATPGRVNPVGSVFASLGQSAENAVSAFSQAKTNAWNEEVRAHTRKTWGEEDRTAIVEDKVAELAFNIRQEKSDRLLLAQPEKQGATDLQSLLPGVRDAKLMARDINKAKRAEAQGRLPPGSATLNAERSVAELYQQYPDMKAEINVALKAEGVHHYMFEEYTQAVASAESEAALRAQATKDAVKIAVDAGVYDPSKSPEENAAQGLLYQKRAVEAKEGLERAKLANETKKENREDAKFDIDRANEDLRRTYLAPLQQKLAVTSSVFNNLVAAAGSDQDKIKIIAEQGPVAMANLEIHRQRANTELLSVGAKPETIQAVNDTFEQTRKGMEMMLTGPLSQFQGVQRAAAILKNNFSIDNAKAFPILSRIGDAVGGPQAVISMMDGIATLPADVQKDLAAELAGMQGADAERGRVHLTNFIKIMKGQTAFKDMTPENARKIIPGVVTATKKLATTIVADKENNAESNQMWMNGSGQLLNAAVELQPGTAQIQDVNLAISAVATPTTTAALKKAMANPETAQDAKVFAYGARGAAAQLLQTAKEVAPPATTATVKGFKVYSSGKNKPWQHVVWDTNKTRFVIETDQDALAKFQRNTSTIPRQTLDPVTGEWKDNPIVTNGDYNTLDPQLVQARDAFNNTTDYLFETAQFDDSAPQGASEKGLRNHYATGAAATNVKGEKIVSSDEQFQRQVDSFAQRTAADTQEISADPILQPGNLPQREKFEPIARDNAQRFGIPEEGFVALITQESGWKPGVQSTSSASDAVGLGQFIKSTAKDYNLTDRSNGEESLRASAEYLRDLYKRHGDWTKALEAYGVIHPSNWPQGRDDPGYKRTRDKLVKAFENG